MENLEENKMKLKELLNIVYPKIEIRVYCWDNPIYSPVYRGIACYMSDTEYLDYEVINVEPYVHSFRIEIEKPAPPKNEVEEEIYKVEEDFPYIVDMVHIVDFNKHLIVDDVQDFYKQVSDIYLMIKKDFLENGAYSIYGYMDELFNDILYMENTIYQYKLDTYPNFFPKIEIGDIIVLACGLKVVVLDAEYANHDTELRLLDMSNGEIDTELYHGDFHHSDSDWDIEQVIGSDLTLKWSKKD